ncbi:hypothetical protein DCAR_0728994 [Daucus carota subsp. sativus]|uniref:Uncharacterized protein n=1 Tax=Daucus carota subsp. sativus TaxID=79200 RepID=A0AAF0XM17_DAUCS|nr:hypothetical protein DCAR_0728994 [Daucus carota subsp. sativus]
MIYRKWSMLTGTIAVTGGAAASVFVADLLFFRSSDYIASGKNCNCFERTIFICLIAFSIRGLTCGLFTKPEPRKVETIAATR